MNSQTETTGMGLNMMAKNMLFNANMNPYSKRRINLLEEAEKSIKIAG